MLKSALLLISLELFACASLPPFPEVWQCAYSGNPRAFYCVNSKDHSKLKVPTDSPAMKGAQCLNLDDYKEAQAWIASVKQIAEQKCH